MKVVLFCGGLGTRMREFSETIPKPMVDIGYRPILWHLMKYYAHYGHRDFVLCLGYRGDFVKKYFLNYDECLSNDFTMSGGGKAVDLANSDIGDWRITFVDTGIKSNIGERLSKVREHLGAEDVFLANYSDGLSDVPLDEYLEFFKKSGKVAAFVTAKPTSSFHVVSVEKGGAVKEIVELTASGLWVNAGFFILRREVFDYMRDGEELVNEPFQRLIKEGQLITYQHKGFWSAMDTFKDKQRLDELEQTPYPPWEVWKRAASRP